MSSLSSSAKQQKQHVMESPLLHSIESGDVSSVHQMALTSQALHEHDSEGRTPLLLACLHGQLQIVQLLTSCDPTVLKQNDFDPQRGGSAIHYAAWGGHLDIIDWLLQQGCGLGEVDLVGNTPLLYAVYGGHTDVVKALLSRGRSLHEVNNKGHTAIIQASCGGHQKLVEWLLDHGASLNERDDVGNTALLFAAWGGHLSLVEWLLERGASLDEASDTGHTALLSAANSGKQEVVEWLLDVKHVNLTQRNHNGDSALLLAAFGGHCGLLEWLLKKGCSLDEKNADGLDPLLSACNGGHRDMVELLISLGCKLGFTNESGYTPVILAACGGHQQLVEWLVARGCSLDDRTDDGDSALLLSCYCGHRDLVEWILDHGGSLQERNKTGLTPLISAANGGHPAVVELLLTRGASIDEVDNDGYSAVLLAARRGYLETVFCLAVHGANLEARTKHGLDIVALCGDQQESREWVRFARALTPLHIAALLRNEQHIRRLLHAGASPLSRPLPHHPTPLDIAGTEYTLAKSKPVCKTCLTLLRQASRPWTPSTHALYGPKFRRSVFNGLLLWRRLSESASRPGSAAPSPPSSPNKHAVVLSRSRISSLSSSSLAATSAPQLPELPPEVWLHILSMIDRSVEDMDMILDGGSTSQGEAAANGDDDVLEASSFSSLRSRRQGAQQDASKRSRLAPVSAALSRRLRSGRAAAAEAASVDTPQPMEGLEQHTAAAGTTTATATVVTAAAVADDLDVTMTVMSPSGTHPIMFVSRV
eukprot:m.481310 g.481310  ORF g.481310 m.481310 type:complete len:763 (+) comp22128_c0_seq1:441-2729(+)